ncbi:AIR synthase-related protein, partial [Haloferax sp. AB510]
LLCVTGELGRSAAAVRLFEAGETVRANDLFRFTPRVAAGVALRGSATAMMDSSDGLARSVHQLAEASDCGFELDFDALPVHDGVAEVATDSDDRRDLAAFFGEDFELVFTLPESALDAARDAADVPLTVVGKAVEKSAEAAVIADGEPVPDRGYTHGGDE